MNYACLAAFIAGIGVGGVAAHKWDATDIARLQMAIDRVNAEAEITLQATKSKIALAEIEARHANEQLETSHAQSLQTINHYRGQLDGWLRERSAGRRNAVPTCAGAGNAETTAASADVSGRAVADLATRADQVAAYAKSCWKFVINNCGVNQ